MKSIFVFISLLVCLSASAQRASPITPFIIGQTYKKDYLVAQSQKLIAPPIDVTNSWIARLKMGGNVTDSSGNGNNGTAVGSPTYNSGYFNRASSAIALNGTSQYVTIGTAGSFAAFTSGDFSISGWYNFNSVGTQQDMFANGGGYQVNGYEFGFTGGGQPYFYTYQSGNNSLIQGTAGLLTASTWYFMVITMKSGVGTMWINGVNEISGAMTNPTAAAGSPFQIGGTHGSNNLLNGSVIDFRVYTRALASYEINTMLSNGPYSP